MAKEFYRDASGRLTYAILEVEAKEYSRLRDDVVRQFGLVSSGKKVAGLDEAFQEFSKGPLKVSIEWDNWSGFMVVAVSPEAEDLVRDIGQYV